MGVDYQLANPSRLSTKYVRTNNGGNEMPNWRYPGQPECTYCGNPAIYKDGPEADTTTGPFACMGCFLSLPSKNPKAINPISPTMAKQIHEMLATPGIEESDGLEDDED